MEKDTAKYKTAAEWQGGDNYPGIDAYEKVQLKAGSKIYAIIHRDKGSFKTPAYFFNKEAMEGIGNDSISLNERLQTKPYSSDGKTASYRTEVVVYRLEKDLVFESGKTAENPAYGKGGYTQYYMPQELVQEAIKNGALTQEAEPSIFLHNPELTKEQYKKLRDSHDQLLLRRNLFCYQKTKLDTLDIIQNSTNPDDVKKAKENLGKLNNDIKTVIKNINKSCEKIGVVPSPLYDRHNKELNERIQFQEKNPNVLFLTNKDLKIEENHTSEIILEHSNISAIVGVGKSKMEEISENLSQKIDAYDPTASWNDINVERKDMELVDVMNINRINCKARELMESGELRPFDYSKVDRIALQNEKGERKEYRLSDIFTKESLETLGKGGNGHLSGLLITNDKRPAKLYLKGNTVELFQGKDKDWLKQQIERLPLNDKEKETLLSGKSVTHNGTRIRVDKDLNRIFTDRYKPDYSIMSDIKNSILPASKKNENEGLKNYKDIDTGNDNTPPNKGISL